MDGLTNAQKSKAETYARLLTEWNRVHRLTGDAKQFWRNFEDAVFPLSFLDDFASFADIGSGAGFPGLAIAIMQPEKKAILIEPNAKKSSFLRFATIELGLKNVIIESKKAQDCSCMVDLIVSRAVADVSILLNWSEQLRNKSSKILLYKGRQTAIINDTRVLQSETIDKDERVYIYIKECEC
jgi:16S rRNA (guanine527-N7)-methyltransferase